MTQQTLEEIERYAARYGTFFDEIRGDVEEFVATGVMRRAQELSGKTGQHFNHNERPQFFVGDLDARFVLVHLNPKQPNSTALRFEGKPPFRTFEEYFDEYRHFGARRYGPSSPRSHMSPFDHKQVRFLRPFGVIDFVEERRPDDCFLNLERVIDHKLQLELIPYGSDSFSTKGFTDEILRPHYERVMRVITARPRAYVIFCGRIFEKLKLLSEHVVDQYVFTLPKSDGTPMRQQSRFATLRLPANGETVMAGLAHSWARQGIPMTSYAEEIRALYQHA